MKTVKVIEKSYGWAVVQEKEVIARRLVPKYEINIWLKD